jgi:hypothetical protein
MTLRTLLAVHGLTAAIVPAAFRWLTLRFHPFEASADGMTAAAVAGCAELTVIRMGW